MVLFLQDDEETRAVVDMFNRERIYAKVWVGEVDEGVSHYKPTHVVVSTQKPLDHLQSEVKWIVCGDVTLNKWATYIQNDNVVLATNSELALRDNRVVLKAANSDWSSTKLREKVVYLPNYYSLNPRVPVSKKRSDFLDVACFSVDNQWTQALAAIEYAGIVGRSLRFHTSCVSEQLSTLFKLVPHQLVEHPSMSKSEFLALLSQVDTALHVTSSEGLNIVACYVASGLPIVVSPEVTWASSWCQVEPANHEEMVIKLMKVTDWRLSPAMKVLNFRGLRAFCENSRSRWLQHIGG